MAPDRAELARAILDLGRGAMVHPGQAEAIAARMLSGPATREALVEAVVAEDPVRWIPLGTAERMADACLRLRRGALGDEGSPRDGGTQA